MFMMKDEVLLREIMMVTLMAVGSESSYNANGLVREYYLNLVYDVNVLRNGNNYPHRPDSLKIIQSFDVPINHGGFFGQRIRGWFIAPQTGQYTFFSSCDDVCEFYISADNDPANKSLVIYQTQPTNNQWDKYPSQTSSPVFLQATTSYYVEALVFSMGSPDSLSIGVQFPSKQYSRPINKTYLSPLQITTCLSVNCDENKTEKCIFENSNYTICTCLHNITCQNKNGLLHEVYDTINLTPLNALRINKNFPKNPSSSPAIIKTFSQTINYAEYYGERIRGWFHAPFTGNYTFNSTCDAFCELYLSKDNDPSNLNLIIVQSQTTKINQWNIYPEQTSAEVYMKANHSYYIVGLLLEVAADDHICIGVMLPNKTLVQPISSNLLSPIRLELSCSTASCTTSKNEICVYENGTSAICTCQNGYKLEGNVCVDIDECADGSYQCLLVKSSCFNTEGSYKCCSECWTLSTDGQKCIEITDNLTYCKTQLAINYEGAINGSLLVLTLQVFYTNLSNQYAHNVTFEYFLPPFTLLSSESSSLGLIRNKINKEKYTYDGDFAFNTSIIHSISITLNNLLNAEVFILDVPVKIQFQKANGNSSIIFKAYRKELQNKGVKTLQTPNDLLALPESYGRGIYWDAKHSHVYVCMNQHFVRTKTACYMSINQGEQWSDMDLIVGSVLGHHSLTNELYALHRNQKTYLMLHKDHKRWFALTNNDFVQNITKYIDLNAWKSLEGDKEQIFVLGPHQWMGNAKGLFFRDESNKWLPRVVWPV